MMLLSRIRSEYLEMPDLRLTVLEAQRLCGGEAPSCQAAMDHLVEERFLSRRRDGTYARLTDGPSLRPA